MLKTPLSLFLILLFSLDAVSQQWHENDIEWIKSTEFAKNVEIWKTSHKLNDDDNFFISRVRPKKRIRNRKTQIRENLEWGINDKRLIAWLPININDEGNKNALPTGIFDSECFTMWSYVDHWGNWSAPLGAIPGGFTDVAHKNGVGVSSLASIPIGSLSKEWQTALTELKDADPKAIADFLCYYGGDGIGYNSEFTGFGKNVAQLQQMHEELRRNLIENYNKVTEGYDLAEIIWYDATDIGGGLGFDRGLNSHNIDIWGKAGSERASLFFNYNWNSDRYLSFNESQVAAMGEGRNPLYIYCGINMQGGEPKGVSWPLLKDYNFSIGLWGAHSENMLWQYRAEKGSSALKRQDWYQNRIENWFTGGSRNPVSCPEPESITTCIGDDKSFHGMSYFMSARSSLGWDLTREPFFTFFNIGNGMFFNWKGERQHNNEWYNIGVQDYMPTWRWWLTKKFLGKDAADASSDLKPRFTWEDAYVGGSCLEISGSTAEEYLHLFKTEFTLRKGDEIILCYKVLSGETNADLLFGIERGEAIDPVSVISLKSNEDPHNKWIEKRYVIKNGDLTDGDCLAVVALRFSQAANLKLLLGNITVRRGTYDRPVQPDNIRADILRNTSKGIDAKIVFNIPNDKPAGSVCYNDEVNASMFKIWAQEEGKDKVLMGITTSWAAMSYATPFEGDDTGTGNIRFGVSSVSLDTETDSDILWTDYLYSGSHEFSDEIDIDKKVITPGESFKLFAVDRNQKFKWDILTNDGGAPIKGSEGYCHEWTCNGLDNTGIYGLMLTKAGETGEETLMFDNYIVVSDPQKGRLPEILSLKINDSESPVEAMTGENLTLSYEGREADGTISRGLVINDHFFGVKVSEVLDDPAASFSVAGWLKIEDFPGSVNFIDIVRPDGQWPRNNWGWLWSSLNADGSLQNMDQDCSPLDSGASTKQISYSFGEKGYKMFNKGIWAHFALVFERSKEKMRTSLYINGKKIDNSWTYTTFDYYESPINVERGESDDFIPVYKALNGENIIIIGGTRHSGKGVGGNGLNGVLDDFQIWNKAMSPEDVAVSMSGLDASSLPDGVAGYWDFETAPTQDFQLLARGEKEGAKAGYFQLLPTDLEGQGKVSYLEPSFTAGSPAVPEKGYKVTTVAGLNVPGAKVSNLEGNDRRGSADIVFYGESGEYEVTLTLTNELGSDSKVYRYITIPGDTGVDAVEEDDEIKVYLSDEDIVLIPGKDGNYSVGIYGIDGKLMSMASAQIESGESLRTPLKIGSGIYVVRVSRDGNDYKAIKILKK